MPAKWTLLHVTVRDALTRELMPARIHVERADGTCYLPPAETDAKFDKSHAPPVILADHFRLLEEATVQPDPARMSPPPDWLPPRKTPYIQMGIALRQSLDPREQGADLAGGLPATSSRGPRS